MATLDILGLKVIPGRSATILVSECEANIEGRRKGHLVLKTPEAVKATNLKHVLLLNLFFVKS